MVWVDSNPSGLGIYIGLLRLHRWKEKLPKKNLEVHFVHGSSIYETLQCRDKLWKSLSVKATSKCYLRLGSRVPWQVVPPLPYLPLGPPLLCMVKALLSTGMPVERLYVGGVGCCWWLCVLCVVCGLGGLGMKPIKQHLWLPLPQTIHFK